MHIREFFIEYFTYKKIFIENVEYMCTFINFAYKNIFNRITIFFYRKYYVEDIFLRINEFSIKIVEYNRVSCTEVCV